jgi:retron-type reverse transcriptase
MLVLEPIFEADLQPEQYAYRPERSANDAVKRVHRLLNTGHNEVVDCDLSNYLEASSYCPPVHADCSNRLG